MARHRRQTADVKVTFSPLGSGGYGISTLREELCDGSPLSPDGGCEG